MGFSDEAARALPVWFGAGFADGVTYNGTAILGHMEYAEDEPSKPHGAALSRATLMVRKADVAAWAYRDTVVAAGRTWRVLDLAAADAVTWTLNLTADERPVYR